MKLLEKNINLLHLKLDNDSLDLTQKHKNNKKIVWGILENNLDYSNKRKK